VPKRGVFTKRRVQCSQCAHAWYVEPQQVGKDICPKCAKPTRLKAATSQAPTDSRLKVDPESISE